MAENIALREHIIELQTALDSQSNERPCHLLRPIRIQLESKLEELGDIVKALATVQSSTTAPSLQEKRANDKIKSNRLAVFKPLKPDPVDQGRSNQEGRLPTIVENKRFPRVSLEGGETSALSWARAYSPKCNDVASACESAPKTAVSPVLRSPPSASLPSDDRLSTLDLDRDEYLEDVDLASSQQSRGSQNLQSRKKRRQSSTVGPTNLQDQQVQRLADRLEQKKTPAGAIPSLKVGPKRKGMIREEINEQQNVKGASFEPKMLRPADQLRAREAKESEDGETGKANVEDSPEAVENAKLAGIELQNTLRKALEPKCVNIDPMLSPKKSLKREVTSGDRKADSKPIKQEGYANKARQKSLLKGKVGDNVSLDGSEPDCSSPRELLDDSEKARLDCLSSASAMALSTIQDTPPPLQFDIDNIDGHSRGSLGRSSRRAKGAVNYVQPNLRDKMRRPTKELVDAVKGEGKVRVHKDDDNVLALGRDGTIARIALIEGETKAYDAGHNSGHGPQSPLLAGVSRDSNDLCPSQPWRNSVSDLNGVRDRQRARQLTEEIPETLGTEASVKGVQSVGIVEELYSFRSSSPTADVSESQSKAITNPSRRVSRRHSSVQIIRDKKVKSTYEPLPSTRCTTNSGQSTDMNAKKKGNPSGTRDQVSKVQFAGGGDPRPDRERTDRIATRRRSMMI